jgi:ADP-ribosylglycohydrolase
MEQEQSLSRAVLYGVALGDALGWPTEFKSLEQIKNIYGKDGIQELPDPAIFTDDTQMTLAIVRALLKHPDGAIEPLMGEVVQEFIEWAYSPENNRAPGNTCMAAIRNLEEGIGWKYAGIAHSKGCGSAMRVAPIGYLYQHQPERLREVAHTTGIATHRHPTGDAAAIAAAYLVKLALDGYAPLEMIKPTVAFIEGISMNAEAEAKLRQVAEVVTWDDEEAALEVLGRGWIGEEAVALALYCCARYPDDWLATVRRGANTNGDSDSIASIAGGIQAARLGLDSIPPQWIERIEKRDELARYADQLAVIKDRLPSET